MKALSELGISPWPWKAENRIVCDDDDKCILHTNVWNGKMGITCINNASLIAAAPEMAKVCYDLIMWDGNLDAKFLKIIDDAKTAYAKASGEEAK